MLLCVRYGWVNINCGEYKFMHTANLKYVYNILQTFKVKSQALDQLFRSTPDIVEGAMDDLVGDDDFNLPTPSLLKRQANRVRQSKRPIDPATLDFKVF